MYGERVVLGQHILSRYCHERAKVFEVAGRYDLSIFPVAGPGYADLRGAGRNVVEELASIIIFCKVCNSGGLVGCSEMGAIEAAGEVLANTST